MTVKRIQKNDLLEGLDADKAQADKLANVSPEELEPLQRLQGLQGLVERYDRPFGSCHWRTPGRKSKDGGRSIAKSDPIPHWSGPRPRTTPGNIRFHEENRSNWNRIFQPSGGPNTGSGETIWGERACVEEKRMERLVW